MRTGIVGGLGILLALAVTAGPAAAQRVHVEVGVHAPPISARVSVGDPGYRMVRHPASVWVTVPYLARLHRAHTRWLVRQEARLYALRPYPREYHRALRAFERERARRERELDRAYWRWVRDQERGHRGRGHHR